MTSRLVLLLGTGRCGSSLLHELVVRHPDVGFISNVQDRLAGLPLRGRRNQSVYDRVPAAWTRKGRLRFAPSEGYRLLSRDVSPMLADSMRDLTAGDLTPRLAARLEAFFSRHAKAQGRPVFSHKLTGWPRARLLGAVFPNARFIHVVRDGRAVANSFLQMPWWRGYGGPHHWRLGPLTTPYAEEWEESGRSFVVLAAIGWKILIDAFEESAEQLPDEAWLTVRYEDLLSDPAAVLDRVLEHAGLAPNPRLTSHLDATPLGSARIDAWRRDLTPVQIAALERSLASHLPRFGY